MRALLIDPFTKTVSEVDYDGDYKSIYKLIDCGTFDVVNLGDGATLFVDDEGLYSKGDDQRYFSIDGRPLAGKALILGTDRDGETVACPAGITKAVVDMLVSWPAVKFTGVTTTSGKGEVLGKPGFVVRQEAHFEPVDDLDDLPPPGFDRNGPEF